MHNGIAAVLTFFICVTWLKFTEILVKKNLATSATVRKWVHIGTGPIFLLCWYLFGLDFVSSLYAAFVPGVITLRFALIGLGILKKMSRLGEMIVFNVLIIVMILVCFTFVISSPALGRPIFLEVNFRLTHFFILCSLINDFALLKDEETVKSMSRSGSAHELLFGPLAYGIIFILRYFLSSE